MIPRNDNVIRRSGDSMSCDKEEEEEVIPSFIVSLGKTSHPRKNET